MLLIATDENFNGSILRGLRLRLPHLNVIRVQDSEMYKAPDPVLLEWCVKNQRVLLTHDTTTMTHHMTERAKAALELPRIVLVPANVSIGQAIDELILILECSIESDWESPIRRIPL
ncbi:MAG TPA: DUF5615 family PIN-like protein [Tepidisphaeraceae bacterium]|jgi:hypothetical protein|nr:DUF5615 family PIN-like protein [Tepidisphaeraceae bacterium]